MRCLNARNFCFIINILKKRGATSCSVYPDMKPEAFYENSGFFFVFCFILATLTSVWQEGCIDLPTSDQIANVIFEGTRGTSYYSDIGLDDVTLERGRCSDSQPGNDYLSYILFQSKNEV